MRTKSIKTTTAIMALALLVSGVVACSSRKSTSSKSSSDSAEWTIGNVGAYTGVFAANVAPARAAIQAWASAANAKGGINGHKINLVIKDDGGDAAKALTAVRQLVEENHVIAIVGAMDIDSSSYAAYLQQKGVPMIGGLNSAGAIWDANPMFFTSVASDSTVFSALPALLHAAGGKTFGTVSCSESPGCASNNNIAAAAAHQLGMKSSFRQLVTSSLADYSSVCLAAKGAGVDSLAILDSNSVVLNIISSCARQGYKPMFAVQGQTIGLDSTLANPATAGTLVVSETFPFFPKASPAQIAFHDALDKFGNGTKATDIGAVAYSGGELFRAAAEAGKLGDKPTSADVVKGLYALPKGDTVGGLTPPINYTEGQGHVTTCYFSYKIGTGKFELADSGNNPICPK